MALTFTNASGNHLTVATPAIGSDPFCVGGWYFRSTDAAATLGCWGNGPSSLTTHFALSINTSHFPRATVRVGTNTTVDGPAIVPLNTWTHLCMVRRTDAGGLLILYVDGMAVAQSALSTGAVSPDATTRIGRIFAASTEFGGVMDQPFIDSSAGLEPHQVEALARGARPCDVTASPTMRWFSLLAGGNQMSSDGIVSATQVGSLPWAIGADAVYRGSRRRSERRWAA